MAILPNIPTSGLDFRVKGLALGLELGFSVRVGGMVKVRIRFMNINDAGMFRSVSADYN